MTAYNLPQNPDLRLSPGWENELNDLWCAYEGKVSLEAVYQVVLKYCRDKEGNLRTL